MSKSHVSITVMNRSMLIIYQLSSNDLQNQVCTEPSPPGSHLPLVKAQSSARWEADKPQSNTHPESCTSPSAMSDRQMSASHPWEVRNCSWWCRLGGTSAGARCAGCRRPERTFQRGREGRARRAAEEEAGRGSSAGLEGEMCCNDRHMARKQVGGRILERYWTSQSEEHREPHQLVLLEVLDNTLKN